MKIVLAAHRLRGRAGSELYVTELARAFAERGAVVALATMELGAFASEFEAQTGIKVHGPLNMADIVRFGPDIVHTHHISMFHLLGELFPGAPRVHGILGAIPNLEQAPMSIAEASRVFVVSERLRDLVLARAPQLTRVEIIRNWFDERDLVPVEPRTTPDDRAHNILVVSNRASKDRDAALDALAAEGFVRVTKVGGARSVPITGRFLKEFDCVVTIGRTVLLAAAVGVPSIVADEDMSDGLLTHDVVDRLATKNFTGREFRHAITPDHLRGEILRSKQIDRIALARKIRAEFGLASRAQQFLSIYDDVLGEWRAGAQPMSVPHRSEGAVYLEMARRVAILERDLKAARAMAEAIRGTAMTTEK